ncbi:MAG TPA: sigma-70 family RNA polymerase sigma factor [Candidatus Limnocylindria bacterium]|nr:sigma-70 family RNA polymerase sigma factor [Candidatus Limnocylindria bacterium]
MSAATAATPGGVAGRPKAAPDAMPGVEATDEALCARVAGGDEQAFDALVSRYQGRAYRLAWSILRDAEDARDVSQDAFVTLYRSASTFRGGARFSTWFYRILVNQCLDLRRRGSWWRRLVDRDAGDEGEPSLTERQAGPASDPAGDIDKERMMARLWTEVDRLAPRQRAALLLHVQEELPAADIASVLGCSEATVRVHLHRAVQALKKTLR